MKKRILALLLAGLMTASLASCVTTQERPNGSQNGGTEAIQNPGEQNTNTPVPTTWSDINDTVYVVAAMTLTAVDNPAETTTVRAMDKLQRTKIGSNNQSIVLKDGKAYYAASKNLTNEDLLGENFTTLETAKTMYIKEQNVNIRTYASSNNSYSPSVAQLAFNDTVKVVAVGSKWSKIEYVKDGKTNYYFVFSAYLSVEKAVDPDDIKNYPEYQNFSRYDESQYKTMYVIVNKDGGSLAVRKCPSAESTSLAYLVREDQVTVVAKGTVGESEWCEIVYVYTDESVGTGSKTIVGFVNSKYISETKSGVASVTLTDMINQYPTFTALSQPQTMYATGKLFVRSSPEFPEKLEDNYVTELQKAEAVKVVATGMQNDVLWAMLEGADGEYFFASYHYLTTDPSGEEAPMTLEQIIAAYPNFTPCAEQIYYAKNVVNCNKIPDYQEEEDVDKKLNKGDAVTVVAKGKVGYVVDWYVFRADDGKLYFAGADLFSATPVA